MSECKHTFKIIKEYQGLEYFWLRSLGMFDVKVYISRCSKCGLIIQDRIKLPLGEKEK